MSDSNIEWKKRFAPTLFMHELATIGPFRIEAEPEILPQGKFRCRLVAKDGEKYQLTTYEGTIGNVLKAAGDKGWCVAYLSKDINPKSQTPYINFRALK